MINALLLVGALPAHIPFAMNVIAGYHCLVLRGYLKLNTMEMLNMKIHTKILKK